MWSHVNISSLSNFRSSTLKHQGREVVTKARKVECHLWRTKVRRTRVIHHEWWSSRNIMLLDCTAEFLLTRIGRTSQASAAHSFPCKDSEMLAYALFRFPSLQFYFTQRSSLYDSSCFCYYMFCEKLALEQQDSPTSLKIRTPDLMRTLLLSATVRQASCSVLSW